MMFGTGRELFDELVCTGFVDTPRIEAEDANRPIVLSQLQETMRKSISGRRVPRKIGGDNDEDDEGPQAGNEETSALGSAVKRPSSKPRKPSSLRSSLGPSVRDDQDDFGGSSVVTPKRSQSSRLGIQRSAVKRSSNLASQIPLRNLGDDEDRPNYNTLSLQELKDSTPSTPNSFADVKNDTEFTESSSGGTGALDLVSKFGSSLARYQQPSAIPSAAEIAEKKARRARLAKEEKADEYISLDPSDPELDDDENVTRDEYGRLILKPKDKYGQAESRLVRDDEDIMEDFDEFTEDGRISLGRKAEVEAAQRKKQEMAAQIAAAEGGSESDSDASEHLRNAAFEAAQTKHGTYGQGASQSDPADQRPKTPPIISPLPTLDGVIEQFRMQLLEAQTSRMRKMQEMEALQREKIRLAEEEIRIQQALDETAEKFKQLRSEKGITNDGNGAMVVANPASAAVSYNASDQGLAARLSEVDPSKDDESDASADSGLVGSRGGLGLGMARAPASDSDDY